MAQTSHIVTSQLYTDGSTQTLHVGEVCELEDGSHEDQIEIDINSIISSSCDFNRGLDAIIRLKLNSSCISQVGKYSAIPLYLWTKGFI